MIMIIIICGLNGAGKSTLSKALADKTGWTFNNVEEYLMSAKMKTRKVFAFRVIYLFSSIENIKNNVLCSDYSLLILCFAAFDFCALV